MHQLVPASGSVQLLTAVDPAPVGSEAWWAALARTGTPLVSPDPEDASRDLVTFVHRDAAAAAVFVDVQPFTDRSRLTEGLLERVPGTDVWARTFRASRGWVGAYGFLPLDEVPQPPAGRDTPEARAWWLGLLARKVADPLNPWPALHGMRGDVTSLAAASGGLPDVAASVRVAASPARPGALTHHVWRRTDLEPVADVDTWVYLPPPGLRGPGSGEIWSGEAGSGEVRSGGGDAAAGLPLVVVHDGQQWEADGHLAATLDHAIAAGVLPPLVAVLVSSGTHAERSRDLTLDRAHLDGIADALVPDVARLASAQGVQVTTDPARTAVAGQSYGGLAAVGAVLDRPDRFGLALGQSASLWWPDHTDATLEEVPRRLADRTGGAARVVLQVGAHEGFLTVANRRVRDLLAGSGELAGYVEVDGGHDWAWWRLRLVDGLRMLLAP